MITLNASGHARSFLKHSHFAPQVACARKSWIVSSSNNASLSCQHNLLREPPCLPLHSCLHAHPISILKLICGACQQYISHVPHRVNKKHKTLRVWADFMQFFANHVTRFSSAESKSNSRSTGKYNYTYPQGECVLVLRP